MNKKQKKLNKIEKEKEKLSKLQMLDKEKIIEDVKHIAESSKINLSIIFNNYYTYDIYPLEEINKRMDDMYGKNNNLTLHGFSMKASSLRYQLFNSRKQECVSCGLKASFWALQSADKSTRPHLNLYGVNNEGDILLFTRDHIVPRALGGGDNLSNLQVMCDVCNLHKKDTFRINLEQNIEQQEYIKDLKKLYGESFHKPNEYREILYNQLDSDIERLKELKQIIQNPTIVYNKEINEWWDTALEDISILNKTLNKIGRFVMKNHVRKGGK